MFSFGLRGRRENAEEIDLRSDDDDDDDTSEEEWRDERKRQEEEKRSKVAHNLARARRMSRVARAEKWRPSMIVESLNDSFGSSETSLSSMQPFVPMSRSDFSMVEIVDAIDKKGKMRIIKEGVVRKRNQSKRALLGRPWRTKYLVISPGVLKYGRKKDKLSRTIRLGIGTSVSKVSDGKNSFRFIVNISKVGDEKRKHKAMGKSGLSIHFKTTGPDDLNHWIDAITKATYEGNQGHRFGSSTLASRLRRKMSRLDEKGDANSKQASSLFSWGRSNTSEVLGRRKLVKAIQAALRSYSTLQSLDMNDESLMHIAKAMVREHYGSGDYIMSEGKVAKKFFVIDSGQCEVLRTTRTGGVKREGELNVGQAFGETGVIYGGRHAVSVRAIKDSVVWAIPKSQLLGLFGQKHTTFSERKRILKSNTAFRKLHEEQLDALCRMCEECVIPGGQNVYDAGEDCEKIYFIVKGGVSVGVARHVEDDSREEERRARRGSRQEKDERKTRVYEVDKLYENASFGDIECILRFPHYVSTITALRKSEGSSADHVILLALSRATCESIFSHVTGLVAHRLIVAVLRSIPALCTLPVHSIITMLKSLRCSKIVAGTCVVRAKTRPRKFIIIVKGTVNQVERDAGEFAKTIKLRRGATFGSMSTLEKTNPSEFEYVTETDVELMSLPSDVLHEHLETQRVVDSAVRGQNAPLRKETNDEGRKGSRKSENSPHNDMIFRLLGMDTSSSTSSTSSIATNNANDMLSKQKTIDMVRHLVPSVAHVSNHDSRYQNTSRFTSSKILKNHRDVLRNAAKLAHRMRAHSKELSRVHASLVSSIVSAPSMKNDSVTSTSSSVTGSRHLLIAARLHLSREREAKRKASMKTKDVAGSIECPPGLALPTTGEDASIVGGHSEEDEKIRDEDGENEEEEKIRDEDGENELEEKVRDKDEDGSFQRKLDKLLSLSTHRSI